MRVPALPGRARQFATILFFVTVLAIHARRCVALFTPAGGLFNDQPLVSDDNSMHSFYAEIGAKLIERTGQPYGYVPTEMAGHPKTPIYDAGIVPVERLMAALSFLPPFLVYKLFVLFSMAAVALCPLVGLRLLGLRGFAWALGWLLLSFPYWWGLGAVFTVAGMNTYLTAASMDLLLLCATVRLVQSWSWPVAALAAVLMCFGPWVHPVSMVAVGTSAMTLLLLRRKDLRRTALFLGAVGLAGFVVNHSWMSSTRAHAQLATPIAEYIGAAQSPLTIARTVASEISSAETRTKLINRSLMAGFAVWIASAGIAALVWLRRRGDQRFLPLLAPLLVLGFLTFFSGPVASLQNMQPWRLRFLWLMVAGALAALLFDAWWSRKGWRRTLVAGSALLSAAYFLLFDLRPPGDRLQVGFTDIQKEWLATINRFADERARVLVEDGRGYGGITPASFHLGTHTQWVGGPYHLAYLTYHKVNFIDGRLSGRPIDELTEDELAGFLRRYNVHWIMAWSERSKRVLDAKPSLVRRLREVAGVVFYENIRPEDSFFERGTGRLSVDVDAIRIADAAPENGRLVLRYHYYDHLVVEGAREVRRYEMRDDPIGFIEVVDPGPTVRIHSSHGR